MGGIQLGLLPTEGWQCPLRRPESTMLGLSGQLCLLPLHLCPPWALPEQGQGALDHLVCENLGCGFLLVETASSPHSPFQGSQTTQNPQNFFKPPLPPLQCSPVEATLYCVTSKAVLVLVGFLGRKIGFLGV